MKFRLVIVLSFSAALVGCAGVQPRYHRVEKGESLEKIAAYYEVPLKALSRKNESVLASGLTPGEKLYIPFEDNPKWNSGEIEDTIAEDETKSASRPEPSDLASARFAWPVMGAVSSNFGPRRGKNHEGIDIVARKGTPVKASRSGHVIYASNRIRGYGNLIIVKHADQFATVYAHLSQMLVKKGQFVARGKLIGRVGATGRAHGTHLHFEVRNARVPVDPLSYLHGQVAAR